MSYESVHGKLIKISRILAALGGLGIIFISTMICVDVILRKFFGTTLGGASEVAGFIFAVGTAIAYPYVLLERAHIRIDVVYNRLSARARAFLDLAAMVLMLIFATRLTISAFDLLVKSWEGGSRSVGVINIPLWVPQSMWVVGFILFTFTALFLTAYSISKIRKSDWRAVNAVAGVPSIEETIEEETYTDELVHETLQKLSHKRKEK